MTTCIKQQYINKLLKNEKRDNNFNRSEMLQFFNSKRYNKFYSNLNSIIGTFWKNGDLSHHLNIANSKHNNSRHLFVKSLTHKSYFLNRQESKFYFNYERNEFIGDSHLNYLIKRFVYNKYGKFGNEHLLSKISTFLISKNFYKLLFDDIGLYPIVFADNETTVSESIKEDILESFIHSFYCNFGIKYTKVLINKLMKKYTLEWILNKSIDYKTILNEEVFKKYNKPIHKVIDFNIKTNHKRQFYCLGFSINGKYYKNTQKIITKTKFELIEKLSKTVLTLI